MAADLQRRVSRKCRLLEILTGLLHLSGGCQRASPIKPDGCIFRIGNLRLNKRPICFVKTSRLKMADPSSDFFYRGRTQARVACQQ
ncbi:MAG: hypothetical protein CMJ75_10120 [Planctomycetaceae bacterium]|nr:hypothetical protein [Planctomycetaceae bacterium]